MSAIRSVLPPVNAMKSMDDLKVLFVGETWHGSTALQRVYAMTRLGADVTCLDSSLTRRGLMVRSVEYACRRMFRLGVPIQCLYDRAQLNERLIAACRSRQPDVLWIEKGVIVQQSSLAEIRSLPHPPVVVGYSLDDMGSRHNQSQRFLECLSSYDVYVTTKSYGVDELKKMGARRVLFVNNAFDPLTHRPPAAREFAGTKIGIGFIGAYEKERYTALRAIARAGHKVRVVGSGAWPTRGLGHNFDLVRQPCWASSYRKSIWGTQINLGFLRKCNRDLQTTRSVEIPACGGFMLAERTSEHLGLFTEGLEADYFSTLDELLCKIDYYLARPELCREIGFSARARCEESGYSYDDQIKRVLGSMT